MRLCGSTLGKISKEMCIRDSDHCFQVFIFNLKFLKGKIIHINDKTIVTVFDLGDDFIKILELMLIGLNDTKSLIIILVQDSLDTGRFTGSRITKEQTVVRLSPLYKCLCIINELFLGDLISYQIICLLYTSTFQFRGFLSAETEYFHH